MRRSRRRLAWIAWGAAALLGGACAHGSGAIGSGPGGSGSGGTVTGAGGATTTAGDGGSSQNVGGTSPAGSGGGGGAKADRACPANQFMTGFDGDKLACAPLDAVAKATVNDGCAIYAGSLDSCDGCSSPPALWGKVSGSACSNGVGAENSCSTFSLGGQQVQMFGLEPTGDVDDNDKLYLGLHCEAGSSTSKSGPCGADELVSGVDGDELTCGKASAAILGAIGGACAVYYGISDGCTGCSGPPTKWGFAGDGACQNGVGVDSTCVTATLGGESVKLFGLNPDGDVDDNDQAFVGLHCQARAAMTSKGKKSCPAGQFVTGIDADGALACASPGAAAAAVFSSSCHLYFGWQDGCSGCLNPPSKWGSVTDGSCALGVGANDTCSQSTLGAAPVNLFGLNFGGDVDANDKLHFGFVCY